MSVNGIGQNYDYLGTTTNYMQKKTPVREEISKTAEQSVNLSISDEGKEYYRNSIRQDRQESYETMFQRREQLKNEKVSFIDYGYEISKKAAQLAKDTADTGKSILGTTDKANGYVKAYAELYDEIVQGYENGTREIYVADENGTHKLTKEEELSALDTAYKKTVDDFVTREETNQHARQIIGEEMEKISKISKRETLAADYLKEQKARGTDKVTENLNEKMFNAVALFKEKYAVFNPNVDKLSQLLMGIKIS